MLKYIIKRLLLMVLVLVGVTVLIFTIMYFVPGDPVELIYGTSLTQVEKEVLREKMGLNDPFHIQLFKYLESVFLHFDLGTSYVNGSSISANLFERLPRTFTIGIGTVILAVGIGVPLGINAALHQGKFADTLSMIFAMVGMSMPPFWFALMLVLVFSLHLGWLPALGMGGLEFLILPWFANCVGDIAMQARHARSSMLEVVRADYVITAKAKGVSEKGVIFKHALPNALLPIVTVFGSAMGRCFSGAMVIENVFMIPGIGLYMIEGINNRDYPAVQGAVVLVCFLMCSMQIIIDLLYTVVDPRIKTAYVSKKKVKKHVS